ncbi:MAG: hypothetical protein IKF97_07450 [Clostridia bacterium]|nr:hypothetical protein [Clostridia bacterium]
MNKKDFISKLKEATGYDETKCNSINEIIESHFIIGKNGKEQIISDFKSKLLLNDDDADKLYNICMELIGEEIKNKLKHPFKSQD